MLVLPANAGSTMLILHQSVQLIAKSGNGNGTIIGPPAIFCRRSRALHANQLPTGIGFQHQWRTAVSRERIALM